MKKFSLMRIIYKAKEKVMLELYYSDSCPYCKKVINYFKENDINFEAKNVSEGKNYDKVISLGHKSQVPFLIDTDNNKMMYESDDIINYVKSLTN